MLPLAIEYIDRPTQLTPLINKLAQAEWVAVDTEFLREKTYYPQFCLLQLATPDWVACIDPLALPKLDPLFDALFRPNLLKVFHSARQDLEIFYHLTGRLPTPVFDTQIAAPLLGLQENPGYGMLVSTLLNINLTKAHTRTDWSQRPLTAEQLRYAADDVIYLGQIYRIITRRLAELGRSDWLGDDFAQLTDSRHYQTSPQDAWYKIKGKNKLTGKQLSVMQTLAEWRETQAQKENRPRNWLMRDDLLLEVAKLQPQTPEQLLAIRGMHERLVKRHGALLCQLIREAQQRPPIKPDTSHKASKRTPHHEAILDLLSAVVRVRAEEQGMNPVSLATRRDLEQLLVEPETSCLCQGWRHNLIGKELLGLLRGSASLHIEDERMVITPHH